MYVYIIYAHSYQHSLMYSIHITIPQHNDVPAIYESKQILYGFMTKVTIYQAYAPWAQRVQLPKISTALPLLPTYTY